MNLIMLGASGSGKGTHAKFIQRDFGPVPISTGDLLRDLAAKKDPLILKVKAKYMDKGLLVPDEIVLKVLKDRLAKPDIKKNGFILDGCPRNLEQAKELAKIVEFDKVVFIDIKIKDMMKRLLSRYTCKNCETIWSGITDKVKLEDKCLKCGGELYVRPDDAPEQVKNRIAFYEENIDSLLKFYKGKIIRAKVKLKATREKNYAAIYKGLKEFVDANK